MAQTASRSTRVRFDVFEADLRAGELYQSGVRVKLQSQPFRVLALLLEHAGEVVTREEFQREIWGNGTIVDFEHSLGTAINKLRDALGDSAENPQFIETLAKRGYRFIAPVCSEVPAATQPALAQATSEPAPAQPETVLLKAADSAAVISTVSARQHARTWCNKRLALVCAAGILLAGLATCSFLAGRAGIAAPVKVARLTFSGRVSPGDPQLESLPVMVTDGVRVYFPLIEGGGNVLAEASIAGGETHTVSLPSEIASPSLGDISPDGSKLLVRSHLAPEAEQAIWIVPAHGGTARRIANILAHDACWMPDGQRILYATGNDLYIANENGTSSSRFATLNGRAFWLRWSPDGRKLRFTLLDPVNHTTALWEVSKNGRNLRPLLPGWTTPAKQCCGTWIADGQYFIFQSGDQSSSNLWALAEAGSFSRLMSRKPFRITNGPLVYQAPIAPRIGQRLFCLGMDTRLQLLRFDAEMNRFVPYQKGISGKAEFSRDGQWVAWIEPSDGSLWRSRVDGSERLQLTAPPMQVFLMRWSPDNRQLVVMGREPGKPWKLYVIGASGGGWQLLVHEDRNIADPDWSPDGKKIVFGRLPELMAREAQPKAIQILDVESKQVSTIPGSEGLFSPRWSPDGRYIAATPLDQRKLMLFDTVQNKWLPLVSISVADPAWSHDGKWIYFHAFMEAGAPIYRVSVAGGRLERVADMRNVGSSDVVDYSFSGLAPGDVPLVRARSWTADVYSINLDKQ